VSEATSRQARREPHGPARDQGTVAMFTAIFALFVILLAGLLVDGGLAIHARERAADIAEQAARAGADDIDIARLRETGEPKINTGTACGTARGLADDYTDQIDAWQCGATEDEVQVTITIPVQPQLLNILPGLGEFRMTSTASAHPERGNDEG
jgi:hypothetical protein